MGGEDDRISIRTLNQNDLDRVVRMDEQETGRNRRQFFEGKLRRALEESDVRISLGAEVDGLLVGALMGSMQYGEFGHPEPTAIFDTILVDREFRGQKIGAALMEQLLKNLGALRIDTLRTEVDWRAQELIGFLAHHDFAPASRIVLERRITD